MFAYIDPTVRTRLAAQGKLIRFDRRGQRLDFDVQALGGDGFALDMLGPIPLPLDDADLAPRWYAVVRHTELEPVDALARTLRERGASRRFAALASHMSVNSVLVFGDPGDHPSPLVRVHSNCLTGDVFGSRRCDCGPQLADAMQRMAGEGGIIVYMAGHEGRGIGLWAKAATYLLQDGGENTYQANRSLGLPDDSRDFSDAAAILLHFLGGDRPFRLLTNNPKKYDDLREHGLTRITLERHVSGVGDYNRRYLAAKRDWGHLIEDRDLGLDRRDRIQPASGVRDPGAWEAQGLGPGGQDVGDPSLDRSGSVLTDGAGRPSETPVSGARGPGARAVERDAPLRAFGEGSGDGRGSGRKPGAG